MQLADHILHPAGYSRWDNQPVHSFEKNLRTDRSIPKVIATFLDFVKNSSATGLSVAEESLLKQSVRYRRLHRKQSLLRDGETCRNLYFIITGALKLFFLNERGHECIIELGTENKWITDRASFAMSIPSKYNIEALEASQVLQIHESQAEMLNRSVPAFAEMTRMLEHEHAIAIQKRIHATVAMTARERYMQMVETEPTYTNRFTQSMLASYLGMKPETLSRLRKHK